MRAKLEAAGFRPAGEWQVDGERIKLTVRPAKGSGSVYAFLLDGTVVYIGKTETCLRSRMNGYRNCGPTQRTNIRVRALILAALANGSRVEVLSIAPEPTVWNELPVSVVCGLEAGLIDLIHPIWNQLNNRKGNDESGLNAPPNVHELVVKSPENPFPRS